MRNQYLNEVSLSFKIPEDGYNHVYIKEKLLSSHQYSDKEFFFLVYHYTTSFLIRYSTVLNIFYHLNRVQLTDRITDKISQIKSKIRYIFSFIYDSIDYLLNEYSMIKDHDIYFLFIYCSLTENRFLSRNSDYRNIEKLSKQFSSLKRILEKTEIVISETYLC